MTTVRGITSRVDIVWSRDGVELNRTSNASSAMMDNSLMYTQNYTISQLNTTDNGGEYQCEVVINANRTTMTTGSVMLDVLG